MRLAFRCFAWNVPQRAEALASTSKGDPSAEYKAFYALGVGWPNSAISPDTAVKAR